MKLLRYGPIGSERPGILDASGRIRDLSSQVREIGGAALLPDQISKLKTLNIESLPKVEGQVRTGPCVSTIGKIVCVGLNYSDHAAESNMSLPTEPILFMKPSSSVVGPDDDVEIPPRSEKTDWEVELGVVIGKPGRYIKQENAFQHIVGYCVVNDVSERAYQLERGGQWDKGKGCDTFAPIGPWLVTSDEIPHPQCLDLWLEIDGRRCQTGNTATMVFGVAHLVSYISQFMSLQSGDIISTGTPPGVGHGQKPPVYLKAGQTMRLGIGGLGVQQQRAIAARL